MDRLSDSLKAHDTVLVRWRLPGAYWQGGTAHQRVIGDEDVMRWDQAAPLIGAGYLVLIRKVEP